MDYEGKTKCGHGRPSASCSGYRHITCPECGRLVCAGCDSMDPESPVPETIPYHACPACQGTGRIPVTKEEPDASNEELCA